MKMRSISRRRMLALTASAGGIAISGQASAQAGTRIEKFDPALDRQNTHWPCWPTTRTER
jgi:hypothetical protein